MADIGTGYGYYAVRIARVVGASGRAYAQEIDERLVKKLGKRIQAEKLTNVEPVLGKPDAPGLPHAALDAALLADVCHEIDNPSALLRGMKPELRPATRERQRKDHNIAPEFLERDLQEAGFEVTERRDPLGPGYDRIPMYHCPCVSRRGLCFGWPGPAAALAPAIACYETMVYAETHPPEGF